MYTTTETSIGRIGDCAFDNNSQFNPENNVVATISPDGILRFNVDANDENAKAFVECIEVYLKCRVNGLDVTNKVPE